MAKKWPKIIPNPRKMIQSPNVMPFWKANDQANKMVLESQGKHTLD